MVKIAFSQNIILCYHNFVRLMTLLPQHCLIRLRKQIRQIFWTFSTSFRAKTFPHLSLRRTFPFPKLKPFVSLVINYFLSISYGGVGEKGIFIPGSPLFPHPFFHVCYRVHMGNYNDCNFIINCLDQVDLNMIVVSYFFLHLGAWGPSFSIQNKNLSFLCSWG